jgi:hypothetical protein
MAVAKQSIAANMPRLREPVYLLHLTEIIFPLLDIPKLDITNR